MKIRRNKGKNQIDEVRVGTIVKLKVNILGNSVGAVGVCYDKYEIGNREGQSFIFENGNYDGFSDHEVTRFLEKVGFCEKVSGFIFNNVSALNDAFNLGYFRTAFNSNKEGKQTTRTNKTQKTFYCPLCIVSFQITIQPTSETEEEIERGYPKSIEWLEKIKDCPICGSTLYYTSERFGTE